MADIFISYKSERRNAAEHLAEVLADYGYTVWWDYDLLSGHDFGPQIEKELRAARAVIVLWCRRSRESQWVRSEATLAKRLKTYVATFVEETELPLDFILDQTLNLATWDGAPRSSALDLLLRELGRLVRPPQPNLDGLSRTERSWRRFGAPSLASFALIDPIEMRVTDRQLPSVALETGDTQGKQAAKQLQATSTTPSALAWSRVSRSLDIRLYDIFLDENPQAPERALARINKMQLEDWAKIDRTSSSAIQRFREEAESSHPLFIALAERVQFALAGAREREASATLHAEGEVAWTKLDMDSRGALQGFLIKFAGHTRAAEAKVALAAAPPLQIAMDQVLSGHAGPVNHASYSPDGSRIVTSGWDEVARVWEAKTGRLLMTLPGHSDWVNTAVYSPDGLRILTGSGDTTACLWDAWTGKLITTIARHQAWIFSAHFSPDGSRIVSASGDGTASIWDAQTGGRIALLAGHTRDVRHASYSPNGLLIATASLDQTVRIWDAVKGQLITTLWGHSRFVFSARFSPDGQHLVTASSDKSARIWNVRTHQLVLTLSGHTNWVLDAAYSPDGTRIATASMDRSIRTWDSTTGQVLTAVRGHKEAVCSACFSSDGLRMLTASRDRTARTWRLGMSST